MCLLILMFVIGMFLPAKTPAQNSIKRARSVHLWWNAPESTIFYNELTVMESHPGSYFMACGFSHGYFGMQESSAGDRNVFLFSVWDPGKQDDPDSVSPEKRVELVYRDPDVKVGRFGGEGTGGQSFFYQNWYIGETYRFMVTAEVKGRKTEFSSFLYINGEERWKHLVTFRVITGGDYLKGYYSFVEDFRRDYKSYNERRVALYGNGWVYTRNNEWFQYSQATFTADNLNVYNINAGVAENRFFLATGGRTQNKLPLNSTLNVRKSGWDERPIAEWLPY
jgi:hypothetical protein